jgi:hypothetical protein
MPFESRAQQRWMFANHPEMAKEFAEKTDFSKLPEKKGDTIPAGRHKHHCERYGNRCPDAGGCGCDYCIKTRTKKKASEETDFMQAYRKFKSI